MKKTILNIIYAALISLFSSAYAIAQCDTTAGFCEKNLIAGYISDGQQYRALLLDEEVAEFHATFFGGSTYRIVGCSGLSDGNLIFRLYDPERNEMFNNAEYRNAPYWDFEFKSTIDCTIEAQLESLNMASGCAVMLIGFKK